MRVQMARQLVPSPLDRTKRRRGQVNYAEAHAHTPGNARAGAKAKGAQDPAPPGESSSSSDASGMDAGAAGSSEDEGTELEREGKVLPATMPLGPAWFEASPRPAFLEASLGTTALAK